MDPSQPKQIPQRRHGVAKDRHLRFRRVEPKHRNLRYGDASSAREIENLDVVGKAVDLGVSEEFPRDLAPKELEAALRVEDSRNGDQPNQAVARLSEELTIERLRFSHEVV